MSGKAVSYIQTVWRLIFGVVTLSATSQHANEALECFCATWEANYPRAAGCLTQDREELFTFYDFPAAHWRSIRTTNPIESTFANTRLRKSWNSQRRLCP